MTGERSKFEAYQKKLQNICDENNLTYRFFKDGYPIVLKIMPTGGMDGQLSMLENAEETGFISPDAFIMFAYKHGNLEIKTSETFTINDALFGKLKNLYKNMHALWLQFFHCEVIRKDLLTGIMLKQLANTPEDSDDGGSSSSGHVSAIDEPEEDNADDDMDYEDPCDDDAGGEDTADETEPGMDDEAYAAGLDEFAQLVDEAAKIVREDGGASTSRLQKRLNIGYAKAARLMEALEANGVVGPISGPGVREVLPMASEG